jgi:hypothetical protein
VSGPSLFMVFDVESVGLHGEGFAVGWVVVGGGKELESGRLACPAAAAYGTRSGREWVATNAPTMPNTHALPNDVRDAFWAAWLRWKGRGAVLAADCPWPVEARFLAACVEEARDPMTSGTETPEGERDWQGPYPLIDVASVRLAVGLDPLGTAGRLPNELPAHDPLADARQSARLLVEALRLAAPEG